MKPVQFCTCFIICTHLARVAVQLIGLSNIPADGKPGDIRCNWRFKGKIGHNKTIPFLSNIQSSSDQAKLFALYDQDTEILNKPVWTTPSHLVFVSPLKLSQSPIHQYYLKINDLAYASSVLFASDSALSHSFINVRLQLPSRLEAFSTKHLNSLYYLTFRLL